MTETGKLHAMRMTQRALNLDRAGLTSIFDRSRSLALFDDERRALDPYRPPIIALPDESCIERVSGRDRVLSYDDVELVWGHASVDACLGADGDETIPVLALIEVSALERVRVALTVEARGGAYGWEERLRIADYCRAYEIAPGEVGDLVDPGTDFAGLVERYRALADLPRRFVADGVCDLRTAERLRSVPDQLLPLMRSASDRLSYSNRRIFLTMAEEIIRRDGDAAHRELERIARIEHPKRRLAELRRVRYPRLTAMERTIESVYARALRGTGVTLTPPRNFEGSGYLLTFEFASTRELERRLSSAARVVEYSDELLGLLFGNDN